MLAPDPSGLDQLLDDLEPAQREAVLTTTGPVVILAAAGTGKTRVISRRTAYAVLTGAVPPDQVLVVTFTDKAAGEMVQRLRRLGLPGIVARTFHAHALSQLRHFWPSRHDGEPLPELLDSKLALLVPIARRLPGHYRFTPAKDLADEIEWAKSRQVTPRGYETAAARAGRSTSLPSDLMGRVFADYERAKDRAHRIDFDDLLTRTVELLEDDEEAAVTVRARKSWFSVDEYQDTNPLQQRLLDLWAGDRDDVCVVGDEDQTIYGFTGATADYLTGFAQRYPRARVVELTRNYRSTPQVLELANRLLAADGRTKRLHASLAAGPEPTITRHPTAEAELAALVAGVRALGEAGGVAASETAVLVRMNAQLAPIEEAFTRAGIGYQVRGRRFYDRPDVRAAIAEIRRLPADRVGTALRGAVLARWRSVFGYTPGDGTEPQGDEASERAAALDTLLAIVDDHVTADGTADAASLAAALQDRADHERRAATDGVHLLTYHRAKGLEWDAVFLPMLEEGSLPIRQAAGDDAIAEERRLLYVGITRARVHLAISWAERREVRGRETRRQPSRFLEALRPPRGSRVVELPDAFRAAPAPRARAGDPGDPVFTALREWRSARARQDAVPAYVIAHDATLEAIAEARPSSLPQLRRVKGMGPTKLERYGTEILAALGSVSGTGPAPDA